MTDIKARRQAASLSKSIWATLSPIDCSAHTRMKGGFPFLQWMWAWGQLKTQYPSASFEKHLFRQPNGSLLPFMLDDEGYAYVSVTVTVLDESVTEVYPVLQTSNRKRGDPSLQNPKPFDVNVSLMRCLVKAIGFHGLGAHLYNEQEFFENVADVEDDIPDLPPEPETETLPENLATLDETKIFETEMMELLARVETEDGLREWKRDWERDVLALAQPLRKIVRVKCDEKKSAIKASATPAEMTRAHQQNTRSVKMATDRKAHLDSSAT